MKLISIIACCAIATLAAGCLGTAQKPDLLQSRIGEARISSMHLRMLTYEMATSAAEQVSAAADQIAAQSDSPEIRRNTLLWKINFIPACFQAAARRDALLALADEWVLYKQNLEFLEAGAGKNCFGPSQEIAVAAARALDVRAQAVAKLLINGSATEANVARGTGKVEDFARKYPITSLEFQRESILIHSKDLVPTESGDLAELAADVQQDVSVLQLTLNAQTAYMPRIARWQAELLLYDLDQAPAVASATGALKQLPDLIKDAVNKQVPELVERERASVLASVRQERIETLDTVEKMRQATMESISKERLALAALIVDERGTVLKEVNAERVQTVREAHDIAMEAIATGIPAGDKLIDRFFWRLIQFIIPVLIVVITAVTIVAVAVTRMGLRRARAG
jgi:hypothetical protein